MFNTDRLTKTKTWTNVDAQILQHEIIPLYRPAIIKEAQINWETRQFATAPTQEAVEQLLNLSNPSVPIELFVGDTSIGGRYGYSDDQSVFNFQKGQTQFANALSYMRECAANRTGKTAYAGALDAETIIPAFDKSNPMLLLAGVANYTTRLWIGNSSQVSIHFDQQDNLASVVRGKRKFLLFPPEQISNLYIGPLDNTIAGPPSSLVNIEDPDYEKHPKFIDALKSAEVAELEPGDTLYIPSLWWHGVEALGDICMLVNYWWNNAPFKNDAMTPMLFSMMEICHLPEPERKAWQNFFEYYVFRTENCPKSHLPESQQGILGTVTTKSYQKMQSYIFSKINKLIKSRS